FNQIMAWYDDMLPGPERDLLRLVALFDRPATGGALEALRKGPAIPELTSTLCTMSESQWQEVIANLRSARLLLDPVEKQQDILESHPLVREYFARQMQNKHFPAWRDGNHRLYEYFKSSAKRLPDTMEEMDPLFAAVVHGCRAGHHEEALQEIYQDR